LHRLISMVEGNVPESLKNLAKRLKEARDRAASGKSAGRDFSRWPSSGLGIALRIGIELLAALVVGVGIGLLLDSWLGTKPWFLVVFFFLGAAAGILNVYRAASGIGLAPGYPAKGRNEESQKDDERDGTA
jgi:ATP synthase protein I